MPCSSCPCVARPQLPLSRHSENPQHERNLHGWYQSPNWSLSSVSSVLWAVELLSDETRKFTFRVEANHNPPPEILAEGRLILRWENSASFRKCLCSRATFRLRYPPETLIIPARDLQNSRETDSRFPSKTVDRFRLRNSLHNSHF